MSEKLPIEVSLLFEHNRANAELRLHDRKARLFWLAYVAAPVLIVLVPALTIPIVVAWLTIGMFQYSYHLDRYALEERQVNKERNYIKGIERHLKRLYT